MKRFLLITIMLILIILLLYKQWSDYAARLDNSEQEIKAIQHMTVQLDDKTLHIEQEFKGLSNLMWSFQVPDQILNLQCYDDSENPCQIDDTHTISEKDKVSFHYSVPFTKDSFIFNSWIIIPDLEIDETVLEVIEPLPLEGMWTAAATLIGQSSLETVFYAQYKNNGGAFPILKTPEPLFITSIDNIQIFGSGSDPSYEEIKEKKLDQKLPQFGNWKVVLTDLIVPSSAERLIVLPTTSSNQKIIEELVQAYVYGHFILPDMNNKDVLASLVGSILMDEAILKSERGYQEVRSHLTNEQLVQLQTQISNSSSIPITTEWLEEQFFSITGLKTTFITDYVNTHQGELLLLDPRPVISKELTPAHEILSVIQNGHRFYPLKETLELLGYTLEFQDSPNRLNIFKKNHSFQFWLEEPIYLFNDEKYSLQQVPINVWNGAYYMEEGWLRRLFNISVQTDSEQIIIGDIKP
ncbi:hypothetical protein GCM10008967_31440 [Bacillus carboniphilus]|uniref:Copper amine oxidase-like N-terminal domain-containing protein n=1 Tax=Bacillus carboniphilus TaxID=86663 RepID=A0ABN0WIC8_9BACI